VILAKQAEGDFIRDRLADACCAGGKQLLDADGGNGGRRMRCQPRRVAAAGRVAGDVDEVLRRELQTGERPVARGRQCELLNECAALFDGHCTQARSASEGFIHFDFVPRLRFGLVYSG
jgi:hypothetical protein